MDSLIVEHLACLELNECILQPPFHLVSGVQFNDKTVSFDGEVTLYSNHNLEKSNIVGTVPVQVKGTTRYKKKKKERIKHPVDRRDLEVFYRSGGGVLYVVVTINPETHVRQAYYRMLAPLDLKFLLSDLEKNGKDSKTIKFKILEKSKLEDICKYFLDVVEKQPRRFIDINSNKRFSEYRVDYPLIHEDFNDLFHETAYIYGVENGMEIPWRAAVVNEIKRNFSERIKLDDEVLHIEYEFGEQEDKRYFVIEKSLTLEIDKDSNKCKLNLSKVKTLDSFLKCLKFLRFMRDNDYLPIKNAGVKASIDNKEDFMDLEEGIDTYNEVAELFGLLGISTDYEFAADEDIEQLFNAVINVFRDEKYYLITGDEDVEILDSFHIVKLSPNIKVLLFFDHNQKKFINFFSLKTLNRVAGLYPKENVVDIESTKDIEEAYWRVSLYSSKKIKEMKKYTNFSFEVLKASYQEKHHDIKAPYTVDISLDFIQQYDKERDCEYLEIARDLLERHLKEKPMEVLAKINLYQVNLRFNGSLSNQEKDEILDLMESSNDQQIIFACKLLLGNKDEARRIFKLLNNEDQKTIEGFPIYKLFDLN